MKEIIISFDTIADLTIINLDIIIDLDIIELAGKKANRMMAVLLYTLVAVIHQLVISV